MRTLHRHVPLGFLSDQPGRGPDLAVVEQLRPAFLDYDYRRIAPSDVRELAAAGVDVGIWTVNTRGEAQPFLAAGVAYVTTDTVLDEEA